MNRTVCILLGLVAGDWRKEDKINKQKLFVIEPVVESLVQVRNKNKSTVLSSDLLLVTLSILLKLILHYTKQFFLTRLRCKRLAVIGWARPFIPCRECEVCESKD